METGPLPGLPGSAEPSRSQRYRTSPALPVRVCSRGSWQEGRLLNLSERGALVTLTKEVWTGEEVQLVLEVPGAQAAHTELRALAVWRSTAEAECTAANGYGLAFRDDKDSTRQIRSLIDHLLRAGLVRAEPHP